MEQHNVRDRVPTTRWLTGLFFDADPFTQLSGNVEWYTTSLKLCLAGRMAEPVPLIDEEFYTPAIKDKFQEEFEGAPLLGFDELIIKNQELIEQILGYADHTTWPARLRQPLMIEDRLVQLLVTLKPHLEICRQGIKEYLCHQDTLQYTSVLNYMAPGFRRNMFQGVGERHQKTQDGMLNAAHSIEERFEIMRKQRLERRRMLSDFASDSVILKTILTSMVGIPKVILDLAKLLLDDVNGPHLEQRERFRPPLLQLTQMVFTLRNFIPLYLARGTPDTLSAPEFVLFESTTQLYVAELIRFMTYGKRMFGQYPLLVPSSEPRSVDRKIYIAPGQIHEVRISGNPIIAIGYYFKVEPVLWSKKIKFQVFCEADGGVQELVWDYSESSRVRSESQYVDWRGAYILRWENYSIFEKVVTYNVTVLDVSV